MKNILFIALFLVFISCKDKTKPATLTGHVWNQAENVNFANAKIILQEFDNAFEANSKVIATAFTDSQGNFSFNFNVNKNRSYSVFIDSDASNVFNSSLYPELDGQIDFKGSNIPNQVSLIVATKSYTSGGLIHDLGSDSLLYEYHHQYINRSFSKIYINEEFQSTEESTIASGNWIFKMTRYLNGAETVTIDTMNFLPNNHYNFDFHY
jgi:hypothetical protein